MVTLGRPVVLALTAGVALVCVLGLLAAPASAAHGPTEVVSTDTALTADLTGHIVIAADGITLDCGQHARGEHGRR